VDVITQNFGIGWLIEYGLTSHQTHYRSYWGRVLRVKWPNWQCQSTEGSSSPKDQASTPPGPPHHVTILRMHTIIHIQHGVNLGTEHNRMYFGDGPQTFCVPGSISDYCSNEQSQHRWTYPSIHVHCISKSQFIREFSSKNWKNVVSMGCYKSWGRVAWLTDFQAVADHAGHGVLVHHFVGVSELCQNVKTAETSKQP